MTTSDPSVEEGALYRIVSTRSEATPYACFICRASFESEAELFQHRMSHHRLRTPGSRFGPQRKKSLAPSLTYLASFAVPKNRLHCLRCNTVFEDEPHLQRHRDTVHKRPTRAEALAAAASRSARRAPRHLEEEEEEEEEAEVDVDVIGSPGKTATLACVEVLLNAAQSSEEDPSLRRAQKRAHPEASASATQACLDCGDRFRTPAGLRRHARMMHELRGAQ